MNNICVYCGKDVGKEIKRKMDCPHCKKTLYIRQGKVVDEREKEIFDWQKYMDFLVPDIESIRTKVEKDLTQRFKQKPSSHDLIWGMFNHIVVNLREPGSLETIYLNMAQFLESDGKLKQAVEVRRQAGKMQIASFIESDIYKYVKIKNCNDGSVCSECKKENNKIIPIREALKDPLLPIHNCTNKKCRCTYDFISKYDDEYEKLNPNSISEKVDEIVIPVKLKSNTKKVSGWTTLIIFLFFIGLFSLPGGLILWVISAIIYFFAKKKNN
jgi:hypothetical protein